MAGMSFSVTNFEMPDKMVALIVRFRKQGREVSETNQDKEVFTLQPEEGRDY